MVRLATSKLRKRSIRFMIKLNVLLIIHYFYPTIAITKTLLMSSRELCHIDDIRFNCLFDAYKNRLYGFVFAISNSHYIAEEMTQEIFMKVWLRRDILLAVDNIEGYLFAMARNSTLNHLRKAKNDARIMHELQSAMHPAKNDVEEWTASHECETIVREAITLLSPQRKLVYQLSRNEGLNHEQIAGELRLSRNTVKNHLIEALRLIRKHISASTVIVSSFLAFC